MPRKEPLSPVETLESYNPALGRHALVSAKEWKAIGTIVREAARPFTKLAGEQVRPYLRAMTKLAAFVHRLDGGLDIDVVLAPATIRAFLANLPSGVIDEEPLLWRLALEHGIITPDEPVRRTVGRRPLMSPYTSADIEAFFLAARTQSTKLRRTNLLAAVVLGAGCGLVRSGARNVTAADVHSHDDGAFIRTQGRCAKVRDSFECPLKAVTDSRPEGRLLGPVYRSGSTTNLHQLLDNRRGVPRFSVDRLRTTYLYALLNGEANLAQVIAWSGLRDITSLTGYVELIAPTSCCPREVIQ